MTSNQEIHNPISHGLRSAIKKSGLNAQEVSRRADVGNYFIYDVLAGKNANPSVLKLARVAEVLGVTLENLIKIPDNEVLETDEENDKKVAISKPADQFIKLNKGNKLRPFDDIVQDIFIHAVKFCDGNKTLAADGLGMSRSRFYRKMGAHGELLIQQRCGIPSKKSRNNPKIA